jgi:acetate kinase
MTDAILVLNAGSSSIKFSLFAGRGADLALVARGQVGGMLTAPVFVAKDANGQAVGEKRWEAGARLGHDAALAHIVDWVKARYAADHRLAAVGHRVSHGGNDYPAPVRVDGAVLAKLDQLVPLSPLHMPHNLAPIRALLARRPELPQVACFDTAMHHSYPLLEQMFALPRELYDAGVRRYGFHGLSYEYIAGVLPEIDGRAAAGKTVVLHLGSGASMCALAAGRSIASTMGFTAVDGLPMATRSGALDPGVVLYLMNQRGMDARAIEDLIYNKSGLLGVSGVSSDMRVLVGSGEPRAALAVDLFVYRIGRELGSLAAALGGLDAIVFTGGIGEHEVTVRERVCRGAAWLGIDLDPEANAGHGPRISTVSSRTAAWVVPTNEELVIARHTRDVLAGG